VKDDRIEEEKGEPAPHFVSREPFDPDDEVALTPEQEKFYMASQWRLMWWKLRRHKVAVAAGIFLILLYLIALFAEVVAPYELQHRDSGALFAPPQAIHLFHEGKFIGPFTYRYKSRFDLENAQWVHTPDTKRIDRLLVGKAVAAADEELPYSRWQLRLAPQPRALQEEPE